MYKFKYVYGCLTIDQFVVEKFIFVLDRKDSVPEPAAYCSCSCVFKNKTAVAVIHLNAVAVVKYFHELQYFVKCNFVSVFYNISCFY